MPAVSTVTPRSPCPVAPGFAVPLMRIRTNPVAGPVIVKPMLMSPLVATHAYPPGGRKLRSKSTVQLAAVWVPGTRRRFPATTTTDSLVV